MAGRSNQTKQSDVLSNQTVPKSTRVPIHNTLSLALTHSHKGQDNRYMSTSYPQRKNELCYVLIKVKVDTDAD